jgi:hypothetical protein
MSYSQALGALLLPLAALLAPSFAQTAYTSSGSETPKDNNANCSCYVVSSGAQSTTPEYFQYYRFYDFRNLPGGFETAPPLLNNSQNATLASTWQPSLFNSDDFGSDWGIQSWSKDPTEDFPIPMSNSLANVYLGQENNSTFLTLRTSRTEGHQTASEIENQQKNLMHVSMRMYARIRGAKGAVAGFFTFFDDSNESDIEILTTDPTDQIRYTNQPSVNKDTGEEVTAASTGPTGLARWDEWQMHRIDWLPKNSYWYLNNKLVAANTYSVPRKPSGLILNMWSDGGSWSGNMSVGQHAEFQIQWVEMTFNTSGPYTGTAKENEKRGAELETRAASGCENVCKIDGVKKLGTPEIMQPDDEGEGDDGGLSAGAKAGIAIGVILAVLLLAAAAWFFWRKKKSAAAHKNQKEGIELRSDGYGPVGR